jgi:2-dehydropantoate 2-reductase
MKVCIFGAGAIGGHIAARLAAAGHAELSVVARGVQLAAIRERGLVLKSGGQEIRSRPTRVTDDPGSLPPQDLVVSTLKAHALPALAHTFERLLAPDGSVLFTLNGIPWWWNYGLADAPQLPLRLLDPGGALWQRLRTRTLGCVIYSPNELEAPGVIVHVGASHWVMGEPDGQTTPRLRAAIDLFCRSELKATVASDLRAEVWRKLVRNASNNTIAALTRLSLYDIAQTPELHPISINLGRETLAVAAALGWDLRAEINMEHLVSGAERGGPRPSMLQDVLLGRPLETEAILGQTQAFAREARVAVPTIDVILPLLRGLDRASRERQ